MVKLNKAFATGLMFVLVLLFFAGTGRVQAADPPDRIEMERHGIATFAVQSASDTATVEILPKEKIVSLNDAFTLTLGISSLNPVDSLRSFFFSIEVDEDVLLLDLEQSEVGDFFGQHGSTNFEVIDTAYWFPVSGGDSALVPVYDVFDALNQPLFVKGYGDLAKLKFNAVGHGVSEVSFRITYLGGWNRYPPPLTAAVLVKDSVDAIVFVCPLDEVWGDADGSGGPSPIDIDDVVYLIKYIFSGGPAPVPYLLVGDADCSGFVDIDDVVYLIAYIFSGGEPPCDPCNVRN